MSFLKPAAGAGLPLNGAATGFQPNDAAAGLGRMIDVDPSRISRIANGIGNAANGIAAAGGAPAGYNAATGPMGSLPPQISQMLQNHLQMLNPEILQRILARFQPQSPTGVSQ